MTNEEKIEALEDNLSRLMDLVEDKLGDNKTEPKPNKQNKSVKDYFNDFLKLSGMSESDYFSENSNTVNRMASTLEMILKDKHGDYVSYGVAKQFLYDIGYQAATGIRNIHMAKRLFKQWDEMTDTGIEMIGIQNIVRKYK